MIIHYVKVGITMKNKTYDLYTSALQSGMLHAKDISEHDYDLVASHRMFNIDTYENFLTVKELLIDNESSLYITTNAMYPYVLFDSNTGTLVTMNSIGITNNPENLTEFTTKLFDTRKEMVTALNDKIHLTETPFLLFVFDFLINNFDMDKKTLRSLALDTYSSSEYNFDSFDFKSIFLNTKTKNAEDILTLKDMFPNQTTVTIYRGSASRSTALEDSLSWTLSKEKAIWFANRFDTDDCHLYQAEVDIDDILAYIDTSEKECLVSYNSLTNIQEINI